MHFLLLAFLQVNQTIKVFEDGLYITPDERFDLLKVGRVCYDNGGSTRYASKGIRGGVRLGFHIYICDTINPDGMVKDTSSEVLSCYFSIFTGHR